MFGYVRPLPAELKVKEFERFRACYCGLCHALKRRYGFAARFVLNYDFVFLAMLLWDGGVGYDFKRCAASPCRKKCVCAENAALDLCAGYSVILAYWKLRDEVQDEKFFKALGARGAMSFLRGAYNKAKRTFPEFDEKVSASLTGLDDVEKSGGTSLDEPADKFASLLSAAAAESAGGEDKKRVLRQILYHTGRFIYIADGADDMEEDAKLGRYNAVARHFSITSGTLGETEKSELRLTMDNSLGLISAAFELLPETKWTEILRNIIYLGMPDVAERVLDGTFENIREGLPKRYKLTEDTGETDE